MKQFLCTVWARFVAAQQRRATREVLRHLDERTLKDIGLEAHGAALRRQDALAWRAQLGFAGLR